MLQSISTDDEKANKANMELVAESIHAQVMQIDGEYQHHLESNQKVLKQKLKEAKT